MPWLQPQKDQKKSPEDLLQQMRTTHVMGLPWEGGRTFARVFRDELIPSRISFTFRDRGFWAPRSMLVSIPKAAWGAGGWWRRARSWRGLGGLKTPGRAWHCSVETRPWAEGLCAARHQLLTTNQDNPDPVGRARTKWHIVATRQTLTSFLAKMPAPEMQAPSFPATVG